MTKDYIRAVLQGTHSVNMEDEYLMNVIQRTIDEIKKNKQTHGRSDVVLRANVTRGIVLEEMASFLLAGNMNTTEFNHLVPESYAFDFTVEDRTFEVKNVGWGDSWFNFNINEDLEVYHITRPILDTFIKNRKLVNYVLIGATSCKQDFSDYEIKFKWIIEADTFMEYVNRSRTKDGTTHYYDVRKATNDGQCMRISS